jgi:hypothetical protein
MKVPDRESDAMMGMFAWFMGGAYADIFIIRELRKKLGEVK